MTGPRDTGGGRGGGQRQDTLSEQVDRVGLGGIHRSVLTLESHISTAKDLLGMAPSPSDGAKFSSGEVEVGGLASNMKNRCSSLQMTVDRAGASMEMINEEIRRLVELIES